MGAMCSFRKIEHLTESEYSYDVSIYQTNGACKIKKSKNRDRANQVCYEATEANIVCTCEVQS